MSRTGCRAAAAYPEYSPTRPVIILGCVRRDSNRVTARARDDVPHTTTGRVGMLVDQGTLLPGDRPEEGVVPCRPNRKTAGWKSNRSAPSGSRGSPSV